MNDRRSSYRYDPSDRRNDSTAMESTVRSRAAMERTIREHSAREGALREYSSGERYVSGRGNDSRDTRSVRSGGNGDQSYADRQYPDGYGRGISGMDAYNGRAGYEETARKKTPPEDSPGKKTAGISGVVSTAILCLMIVCCMFFLPSGGKLPDTSPVSNRDMLLDIYSLSDSIKARTMTESGLYQMKRTKTLPWNEKAAPEPNKDAFKVTAGEDGRAGEWSYEDETITVTGWTEHISNSKVYFSEVTIAHASQLRTALANGSFPSSAYPSDMARSMNAVLAANGDFAGYRESGMIIRQAVCYRAKQYDKLTWDVLLIDDQGDFHITDDRHIDVESFKNGTYSEGGVSYNIVNSFHFGPSLVVNGAKKILHMQSGCGNQVNETYKRSHTAIGQLGPLRYLVCCVEETDSGMKPQSFGVNIPTMADIMYSKGCIQAYNLDGGQSTTLIFGGNTLNFVNRGGERELSEILYFASAENVD